MDDAVCGAYVRSLSVQVRQRGAELERELEQPGVNSDSLHGRLMAIREALSFMQNQADAFQVSRPPLGLDGFAPDLDAFTTLESIPVSPESFAACPIGYIRDLAYLLRERTVEAANERKSSVAAAPFEGGREQSFREILSWMQHQADAVGLPRRPICLSGFDAQTDPVDPPPPTPLEDDDP
jgi:hypothetical protein